MTDLIWLEILAMEKKKLFADEFERCSKWKFWCYLQCKNNFWFDRWIQYYSPIFTFQNNFVYLFFCVFSVFSIFSAFDVRAKIFAEFHEFGKIIFVAYRSATPIIITIINIIIMLCVVVVYLLKSIVIFCLVKFVGFWIQWSW